MQKQQSTELLLYETTLHWWPRLIVTNQPHIKSKSPPSEGRPHLWSKLSTWPGFEGFKFHIKSILHFFVACNPLLKGPSQSSALTMEPEEEEHAFNQEGGKRESMKVQRNTINLIPSGKQPKRNSKDAIKVNLN